MPNPPSLNVYQRKPLDQIVTIPDSIISVYVVENHIWSDGGPDGRLLQTGTARLREFLISPVRSFLNDLFRGLAAPYIPGRKDAPIGQGFWVQAEFGSGKSHLLYDFIGAPGGGEGMEDRRGKGAPGRHRRARGLDVFYKSRLAKKTRDSKGILVAVKTLVGQGGGGVGMSGMNRSLCAVRSGCRGGSILSRNGNSLPFYPVEMLAERFLNTEDFELYKGRLAGFLKNPAYFDAEAQDEIQDFLSDLQDGQPGGGVVTAEIGCGSSTPRT